MMTGQARLSERIMRLDTHTILETAPASSAYAGPPTTPSTGHYATMAEPWFNPAASPIQPAASGRRVNAAGAVRA
jgi:hypothetical protein